LKKKVDEIDKYNQWLVYGNEKENISGLIANGIPEEKALQLAEELVAFAKYSLKFIERYLDIRVSPRFYEKKKRHLLPIIEPI
jgi:hypothetical protein